MAKQLSDPDQTPSSLGLSPGTGAGSFLSSFQGGPTASSRAPTYPGPTLDVGHALWLRVVSGEEGVVAEAAKAVGPRGLGLGGPQCCFDQLEIHDPWDHQFFLCPAVPVAPWPVP